MKPELLKSLERLEPASFTIIMATGAFSIATKDLASFFPVFTPIAMGINILNFGIFIFLLIFAASTWPFHGSDFRHDLDLPQQSAFYAAIGISFLVLGAQALRFDLGFWLALSLWSVGCFLTIGISFALNYHFFVRSTPELRLFTPVFFIPVGGLMVLPVAGVQLMSQLGGLSRDILLMINSLSLGSGFLLYIGLFSLLLQRHYLMEHLPARLAPTIWIHLAPVGWGGVSFVSFAQHMGVPGNIAGVFGALLWGGCIWWLVMCILLTISALISRQMQFSLAYWAFIFPLCAITVLSYRLGGTFLAAFYFLWGLTALIWTIAAYKTAKSFVCFILRHCSLR